MPNNDDLTRFPLGSNAFPVFDRNVRNLDVAVNDKENECWKDRFGKMRRTWHGMESNFDRFIDASNETFQQFLINSGYQDMGDYGPGLEISARNQIFWRDGELYRAGASLELPYTTTGDWEAEGSFFVAVGDATIREIILSAKNPIELINSLNVFPVDAIIRTEDGFLYRVSHNDDLSADLTTAGGIKLYVIIPQTGLDPRALGSPSNGIDDDAPFFEKAWSITKSISLSSGCTYLLSSVIGLPDQKIYDDNQYRLFGNGATIIMDGLSAGDSIITSASAKELPESEDDLYVGPAHFEGFTLLQRTDSVFINGDRVYNWFLTGCRIKGIHAISKSFRKKGSHNNGYFQSFSIVGNQIADCEWIVHGFKAYNFLIDNNKMERNIAGIHIVDPDQVFSAHNPRIVDNLFEGGGQFMRIGNALSGEFTGNYLESNTIGDMSDYKCNLDLRSANQLSDVNPSTWFFAGNSFQNHSSQTSDIEFEDIKFNTNMNYISFGGGNWTNSILTKSPIVNSYGDYSRNFLRSPFSMPRTSQQGGVDFIKSSLVMPYSNYVDGPILTFSRIRFEGFVIAPEYRNITIDMDVKCEGENANGEVFAVATFKARLLMAPYGSGMFSSPGRFDYWGLILNVSELMQIPAGGDIDTSTGTKTVLMFNPDTFAVASNIRSADNVQLRVNGFQSPTVTGRPAMDRVRVSIVANINGVSRLPGTAARFLSFVN